MHLVMFDIDGTLVDTSGFEDDCFVRAIQSEYSTDIDTDWSTFKHVSDSGIVNELTKNISDAEERRFIFDRIQFRFVEFVRERLASIAAPEIAGAAEFIEHLKKNGDVVLALATGGWRASAELKLVSACIDFSGIAFASSDDHFDRSEIMRAAQYRTGRERFETRTYIGDGVWDKAASKALGFNFILVGNKTSNHQQIDNYYDKAGVEAYIGL